MNVKIHCKTPWPAAEKISKLSLVEINFDTYTVILPHNRIMR